MLKKLIMFAITSGLAAKAYKSYKDKHRSADAAGNNGPVTTPRGAAPANSTGPDPRNTTGA